MSTIQAQYNAFVKENKADAKQQVSHLPNGWYWAWTTDGKRCGMGFFCRTCKVSVPHDAPDVINHCGTITIKPRGFFGFFKKLALPHHKIKPRYF